MNERILRILIESFWQILLPGLTMTIPLTTDCCITDTAA